MQAGHAKWWIAHLHLCLRINGRIQFIEYYERLATTPACQSVNISQQVLARALEGIHCNDVQNIAELFEYCLKSTLQLGSLDLLI